MTQRFLLLAVLLVVGGAGTAYADFTWSSWNPVELNADNKSSYVHTNDGDRPFRLAIEVVGASGTSLLTINDSDSFGELANYPLADSLSPVTFLSDTLFAHKATIQLHADPQSAIRVRIVGLLVDEEPATPQGLAPNWQDTAKFSAEATVKQASESVVRLVFPGVTSLSPTCTGFVFVKPDIIVTDRHCIAASAVYSRSLITGWRPCGDVTIQFGYRELNAAPTRKVRCDTAIESSAQDLAILRVSYLDGATPPTPIAVAASDLTDGEVLYVVQHPVGLPQKIAPCNWDKDDEPVAPAGKSYFRYRCDTAPGSSGAPVLNRQGQLVGIHFWYEADETAALFAIYDSLREGKDLMNRATWFKHAVALIASAP